MIDNESLNKLVLQAVDSAIQDLVKQTIDNLVVDPAWISKIETQINQHMAVKLSGYLSKIDLNSLLVEQIDSGIERWQDRLKKDFKTNGIVDLADTVKLTVSNDKLTVATDLEASSVAVNTDISVKGTAIVNNLSVKGTINTDCKAWDELSDSIATKTVDKVINDWQEKLVADVLAVAKTQGIDFDSISVNGLPIVENDTLGKQITKSNLQSVGTLDNLTVSGRTSLSQTVNINKNRVGVNTENPDMALSVWDEEVALSAGKINKDTAFLGTTRKQKLVLGVNRGNQIEITDDGLVSIGQLRIDRWRISHESEVPGYSGTKGDLVLNNNPKVDRPFAWICLGGFQWHPLRGL